jgi:O-antigen/teichoic acid export membrane protein
MGFLGVGIVAAIGALIAYRASYSLSGGDATLQRLISVCAVAAIPNLLVAQARGYAAGRGDWGRVSLERGIAGLARMVSVCGLALINMLSVESAAVAIIATPALGGLAYLRNPHRSLRSTSQPPCPRVHEVLGFGLKVWAGSLAGIVLLRLDQVLLAPLSSITELGIYAVAVNVAEVPLITNTALREVTFARMASSPSWQDVTRFSRLSLLLGGAISGGTFALAIPLVPFLFGEVFEQSRMSLAVLSLAVVIGLPGSLAGSGLSGSGRPELRSLSLVAGALVNVLALLLLAPAWGAVGAACATLAGNLTSSNTNILWAWRIFGISPLAFYRVTFKDLRDYFRLFQALARRIRTATGGR